MERKEPQMIHTTHSTSEFIEALSERRYDYREFSKLPAGKCFNVTKVDQGRYHYWEKDQYGVARQYVSEADDETMYDRYFRTSEIPAVFKNKGLSSFNPSYYQDQARADDAVRRAAGYVAKYEKLAKNGIGLLIYSKSEGSGKTHLAIAIVNELMKKQQQSARFIRSVNFFAQMKRNIAADKMGDPYVRNQLFDSVRNAHILVVDDLGAGAQTSYTSDLFYELINSRVEYNKVTIYTSKRAFSELGYDNSTLSLIQKKSVTITLPNENVGKQLARKETMAYEDLLHA